MDITVAITVAVFLYQKQIATLKPHENSENISKTKRKNAISTKVEQILKQSQNHAKNRQKTAILKTHKKSPKPKPRAFGGVCCYLLSVMFDKCFKEADDKSQNS